MMCYRDMTFCSNTEECANTEGCHRAFTKDVETSANNWAEAIGLDYTPVAMSEFKNSCIKFKGIS